MSRYAFCPQCARPLAERAVDGTLRPACPDAACGFVLWDNPVPVVAALVEHGGGVMLVRNRAWPEKMFGLVTGFIERGEAPEQAAAREVKEELNLDAQHVAPIGNYAFTRDNQIILAYHVVASGEIALDEELAEYRLIAPERLKPWDFGTGLAVRDWLQARAQGRRP